MMLAIDTYRYVDFCRGDAGAVAAVRSADRLLVPFVVLGELRAGFACGARAAENDRTLTRFLAGPRVEVLHADEQTTHHYGRLFAFLRARGTPIPTNDLWIAALVQQHGLVLFARDNHYDDLPQLARM